MRVWVGIHLPINDEDVLVNVSAEFGGEDEEGTLPVWERDQGRLDVEFIHEEFRPEG